MRNMSVTVYLQSEWFEGQTKMPRMLMYLLTYLSDVSSMYFVIYPD